METFNSNMDCCSAESIINAMKEWKKESVSIFHDKMVIHPENFKKIENKIPIDRNDLIDSNLYGIPIHTNPYVEKTRKILIGIKLKSKKEGRFIEYEERDWSWLIFFGYAEGVYEEVPVVYFIDTNKMWENLCKEPTLFYKNTYSSQL